MRNVVGAAVCILLIIFFVVWSSRAKLVPLDQLGKVYPVAPLGSLKESDFPDQGRIIMPKRFRYNSVYTMTPLATYRIAAHVLSAKDYRNSGNQSALLGPTDLALAWGEASSPGFYNLLNVHQKGRFYFWKTTTLDHSEVIRQTANVHMVSSTREMAKRVSKVRRGDKVRFRGYLVKLEDADGWKWQSSVSRNDTGDGACEVVYITEFEHEKGKRRKG